MSYCNSDNGLLGQYIDNNMSSLNLPMPSTIFETIGSMSAVATAIAEVIEINGTSVSLYQSLKKLILPKKRFLYLRAFQPLTI